MTAWVAPPTFTAAAVLSAAQMNILSDDIEILYGYVSGTVPAMVSTTLTDDGDILHIIRHQHNILHAKVRATGDIKIYYDATLVYHDGSPGGDEVISHDISGDGLVVGQLYTFKVSLQGADNRTVYYAYEAAT